MFTKEDTGKTKGVAIILMLFHHCFLNPQRYEGQEVSFAPFSESQVNYWCLSFKICVAIFTFLSAYGMTLSYKRLARSQALTASNITGSIARRYINLMSGYLFVFCALQLFSCISSFNRFPYVYGTGGKSVIFFLIDALGLGEAFGTPMFVATFWYMALAQAVILIVPCAYMAFRTVGPVPLLGLSALATALFPVTPEYHLLYLPHYLFCMVVGMLAAEYELLEKIKDIRLGNQAPNVQRAGKGLVELTALLALIKARQATLATPLLPVWDGLIAFFVASFLFEYVNQLPAIGKVLLVLGRYSMDIFLIHNFIRIVWFYEFTYSFRHFILIVVVLLSISLVISWMLETLKKAIGYDRLTQRLQSRVV